jgi:hypothetical protein
VEKKTLCKRKINAVYGIYAGDKCYGKKKKIGSNSPKALTQSYLQ